MFCKHQRLRQLNYEKYFYCALLKKKVKEDCYRTCRKLTMKKRPILNKFRTKGKKVSADVYDDVYLRDKQSCRICGKSQYIELHHIKYRSEDVNLINEPTNCIMLCATHHKIAHLNKNIIQPILLKRVLSGKKIDLIEEIIKLKQDEVKKIYRNAEEFDLEKDNLVKEILEYEFSNY